jgi:hypothetical protein
MVFRILAQQAAEEGADLVSLLFPRNASADMLVDALMPYPFSLPLINDVPACLDSDDQPNRHNIF